MTIKPELLRAYKKARMLKCATREQGATKALESARLALSRGTKFYSDDWSWQRGRYNVTIQPQRPHDSSVYAWIENTDSAGLRLVGFADEIVGGRRIDHKGWFTDEFKDDVYRGAVYQLPGRKGVSRYIAGYIPSCGEGAAFVCLDIIKGEKVRSSWNEDDAKREAAIQADSIAECYAERECEYYEQWQAGSDWSNLADDIASERTSLLKLLGQARDIRKDAKAQSKPALCAALRCLVKKALRDIEKMRAKRRELFDDYGSTPGFADFLPREA